MDISNTFLLLLIKRLQMSIIICRHQTEQFQQGFSCVCTHFILLLCLCALLLPEWPLAGSSCQSIHQVEAVYQGNYYSKGHQEVELLRHLLLPMQSHQKEPFWKRNKRYKTRKTLSGAKYKHMLVFWAHMHKAIHMYLSWGVTSLGGFFRYCLKRNSKAWPMVLMTSWAKPSEHSRIWHAE